MVNQKLADADADADASATKDMIVAGPCWPEDASLPRIVERNGEIVLDEGWVEVEDGTDPEPDAGV